MRKELNFKQKKMSNISYYSAEGLKKLKEELLEIYDRRGAEYPAEHNVGHEYKAMPVLTKFYKKLDPTNFFNPGIGQTSKLKNWK